MDGLKRLRDWYAYVPPDLPAGEARIFSGAKIGYSVLIALQGVSACTPGRLWPVSSVGKIYL
ncbi:hypothetical protein [Hoeflea poritis]|uniref:Beta-lactamase-related domain-containing protein n=1 Tax=Hoeflea poritis TaxID=2993659 RepID=A0ABT4VNR6_9HYPH|nr:hypothetical protein [Hoeflea poritis]MDA4846340.1 hypothetical protein [Hoeflea poritis]